MLLLEKPEWATCSYHLELVMLCLFCNTVFPQTRRKIVIFSKCIMYGNSALPIALVVIVVTIRYTARGNQPGGSSLAYNSMENCFQCAC